MNKVIIPFITQTRLTPFQGHLTLEFPCVSRSLLWIESASHNTASTDIEEEAVGAGTQTSADGANKSRWFVVTSIWIFKYLTEQISRQPGDNFLCTEIPDSGKAASLRAHFLKSGPVNFYPSKTLPAITATVADKFNFSTRATGSFFLALFDYTVWGSDYLPSVLMAAPTWTQHYHHNYF